jgi:hypothetical protein
MLVPQYINKKKWESKYMLKTATHKPQVFIT